LIAIRRGSKMRPGFRIASSNAPQYPGRRLVLKVGPRLLDAGGHLESTPSVEVI
jgi:hypothetical protein